MENTKIYGSLARRIALVFLILVISPLLLYVGFLWNKDEKIKFNSAFLEMEMTGNFSLALLNQFYQTGIVELKALSDLPEQERSAPFSQAFSTLISFDQSFVCTYSNREELVGKKDLFPNSIPKISHLGSLLVIETNPVTNLEELFLFLRIKNTIWGISVDLEKWMKPFEELKKGGAFASVSFVLPGNKNEDFLIWSLPELKNWQQKEGLWDALQLRGKNIALDLPVPNAAFNIRVLLPSQAISQLDGGGLFSHIFILFGLVILIGGGGALWLTMRLAKPFRKFYQVMEAVQNKQYQKVYTKDPFGFEINVLGENFNRMLSTLLENMKKAEEEKISRELLTKELEIGRRVQNQLLPEKLPEFPGLALGKGFLPAKEVAGDFYDLFAFGKNELLLSIADGSDKGISPCLYSLMVRSMLRSHALVHEKLEVIVRNTNDLLCLDTGVTGNFVTAWVAVYESDTHSLQYTSAGHLPAVLISSEGKFEELTTEGVALGVVKMEQVQVRSLSLSPGSLLFLYSDGVTDALNEKGELFGKSRLFDFLATHRSLEPQSLIDRLLDEVDRFAQNTAQHDDLTALCVKVL